MTKFRTPTLAAFALLAAGCGRHGGDGSGAPPARVDDPPLASADDTKVTSTAPPTCAEPGLPPKVTRRAGSDAALLVACDGEPGELAVAVFDDGIARLRYGKGPGGSIVPLERPEARDALAGHRGDALVVCTPELELTITPGACRVAIKDGATGATILDDGAKGGFFRTNDALGVVRTTAADERFYGLGLHTRAGAGLDLHGKTIDLWNTDAYDAQAGGYRPDAPSLYESVPFYAAIRDRAAYGVFFDNTHRMRFDLAATAPGETRIEAAGGAVDEWVFAGPSLKDVVRRATRVTGRAPLPPRWALGFQQSRWEGPCDGSPADRPFCSATQILGVAKKLRDTRIPADGLFLDIQHMDGFRSFTFDAARFPQPSAFFGALAALDFHAHTIIDPGIKSDPAYAVYQSGLAGDHFLKDAQGKTFQGQVWAGDCAFPDFSRASTRGWWSELVAAQAAAGVSGMWIDMNEPSNFVGGTVPSTLAADGDGHATTMDEVHDAYGWFEARATFEGLKKARPGERPFVLSRSAFAGQQRWSAVWTGDAPSTWTTLTMTLPQLLSLGLSGISFAGSDVGGYSGRGESTAELFSRWMALGAVSPFFRAHAEKDARRQEPWSFGDDTLDDVRSLVELRYALMPYLYGLFDEAARTGAPVLRPLVFEFQDDARSQTIGDEAMLGPWLLVAPPLAPSASTNGRDVYLPPGRWFELRSGAAYDGGRTISIATSPDPLPGAALPVFVREGAVVPWTDVAPSTAAQTGGSLTIDVFPGAAKTEGTIYEDDGTAAPVFARTSVVVEPTATGARVTSTREGSFVATHSRVVVRVRRLDRDVTSVRLGGRALTRAADVASAVPGTFAYDAANRALVVPLADFAAPIDLAFDYDRALDADGDVDVPVRVTLPAGTPASTAIHVASSSTAWTHVPLARSGDVATGTVRVPRGTWAFFKITRGSWTTVEKGPACAERTNRHVFGAPNGIDVSVSAWADACP